MRMLMKKQAILLAILLVFTVGISYWNVEQQQTIISLRETLSILNRENKTVKSEEQKRTSEIDQLKNQLAASTEVLKKLQKPIAHSATDADLIGEYVLTVTKLYEANLNFTPETYKQRKEEVTNYLSDELIKEYFGQKRNTYQESNGMTSKLISLEVYPKVEKHDEIEGLAVAYHQSKMSGEDWISGMNIFKVTYDRSTKKVIKIKNLGSGYVGD